MKTAGSFMIASGVIGYAASLVWAGVTGEPVTGAHLLPAAVYSLMRGVKLALDLADDVFGG